MQATDPCWEPSTPTDRLMLALGRVLREVRLLDRAGLDYGSAVLLFAVAHHPDGVRASDLAAEVRLDLSTVSRHLRSLELAGHIERTQDQQDRRAALVAISPAGSEALRTIMTSRGQVFERALAGWSEAEQAAAATVLDRLATDLSLSLTTSGAPA